MVRNFYSNHRAKLGLDNLLRQASAECMLWVACTAPQLAGRRAGQGGAAVRGRVRAPTAPAACALVQREAALRN
jgi:hypothetical protein